MNESTKNIPWKSLGVTATETRMSRSPEPREVQVRVLAYGLCGTDTHIVRGEFSRAKIGVVLGHEACAE